MEASQRDRLSELVEELTTSGEQQLNESKMKEIKKLCRCVEKETGALNGLHSRDEF